MLYHIPFTQPETWRNKRFNIFHIPFSECFAVDWDQRLNLRAKTPVFTSLHQFKTRERHASTLLLSFVSLPLHKLHPTSSFKILMATRTYLFVVNFPFWSKYFHYRSLDPEISFLSLLKHLKCFSSFRTHAENEVKENLNPSVCYQAMADTLDCTVSTALQLCHDFPLFSVIT